MDEICYVTLISINEGFYRGDLKSFIKASESMQ